jgi:transposase
VNFNKSPPPKVDTVKPVKFNKIQLIGGAQMKQNIYSNNNKVLKETLAMYKPTEILYAPIEIGKFNHKSCITNFFGDVITKPFEFPNNSHGLNFFIQKFKSAVSDTSAKKVILGCESTGHYHLNLIYHLKRFNLPVEIINPRDSKTENPNKNSKTDIIDLNAIARVLIQNKGSRQIVPEGVYYNLQRATRTRFKLVQRKTSSSNIITGFVDRIFPGLWDKDNSIFSQRFSKASLLILQHFPHPVQIIKLGVKRLANFLSKHNTKLGTETAQKIVSAAEVSLYKPIDELQQDIFALQAHIKCYLLYKQLIDELEQQMTLLLIQTPGIYLLSVDGVSVIHAANFTAEVGNIDRFAFANQIISFAGTCSRKFQTAEYEAQNLHISRKGSKFLRVSLNQTALSLNSWSPKFHDYYTKKYLENPDEPGRARIATGNKFVKLAFALMKSEQLFKPIGFYFDEKIYYNNLWNKIVRKLDKFNISNAVIPENNYLIKIKKHIEDNYGLSLTTEFMNGKGC